MSGSQATTRPHPQWLRFLLIGGCSAGLVLTLDWIGLKDSLYRIPLALEALRLLVIALCLAGALLLLFVKDEEAPRGLSGWLTAAFLLAMAAAQAVELVNGVQPSSVFSRE